MRYLLTCLFRKCAHFDNFLPYRLFVTRMSSFDFKATGMTVGIYRIYIYIYESRTRKKIEECARKEVEHQRNY